jgi:hypothetical protein
MVVIAPTPSSVHPTARRCSSLRRSANSRATPAPKAARVPLIIPSSGNVIIRGDIKVSFQLGNHVRLQQIANLAAVDCPKFSLSFCSNLAF